MDKLDFRISISPSDAADRIKDGILTNNPSSGLTDEYRASEKNGFTMVALVFVDYYMRCSNSASLIVTVHNINGFTCVHAVGTANRTFVPGKSQERSFIRDVRNILSPYIL